MAARASRVLVVACGVNLLLAVAIHWSVLRGFPNSGDENAYLLSATLFSEGRLAASSPEPRGAFDLNHVLNDGKYYGKYTPGWPALLAIGVLAGVPWIVNPILLLVTLVMLHRLVDRQVSRRAADLLAICWLANPFVVFTAASYFPHPACLLLLTVVLGATLDARADPHRTKPYLVMGVAAGASFVVREFTTVAFTAPLAVWLIATSVREQRVGAVVRGLLVAAAGSVPGIAILLIYNNIQTGHPLLPPLVKYGDPGFTEYDLWWGLRVNLIERLARLSIWLPLSVPLAAVALMWPRVIARGRLMPFALAAAGVFGAFTIYLTSAGNEYGPRYVFETVGALSVLMAVALAGLGRFTVPVVALILVMNAGGLVIRSRAFADDVRGRMTVYDEVRRQGLTQAVVFLRTGSGTMRPGDLVRNGTTFDGPVLFVLDRGAAGNREVLARYPDRTAWIFRYDSATGSGTLTRYVDGSAPAASLAGRR